MRPHSTTNGGMHEIATTGPTAHVQPTQNVEKLPIGQRRSEALKEFWKAMRDMDALYSIRSTHLRDVLSGADTHGDLFRVGCSLNGKQICSIPGGFDSILSRMPREERESKFPQQQLCAHLGITEQQYKEIDRYGYRRDVFLVLLSIFEDTQTSNKKNFRIPHVLLLEELVTTLNGGCILGCPYVYIATAAKEDAEDIQNHELYPDGRRPPELVNVAVTCTFPNKITVCATLGIAQWLGIGVETSLSYDITVVDNKFIAYQNVHTTVLLRGKDEKLFKKKHEEYRKNPTSSYNLQQDPPSVFPEREGLILCAPLKGEAFTVQSMLSSTPERVTLTDEQLKAAIAATKEKPRSIRNIVKDFFAGIARNIRNFFSTIKNFFHAHNTSKTNDQSANLGNVPPSVSEISAEHHIKGKKVRTIGTQTPSDIQEQTTDNVASPTTDAQPNLHASSVSVSSVIEAHNKSP